MLSRLALACKVPKASPRSSKSVTRLTPTKLNTQTRRSFMASKSAQNKDSQGSEYGQLLSEKINSALNQSPPGTQNTEAAEQRVSEAIFEARREAMANFAKQQSSGSQGSSRQTITVKSPSRDSRR